MIAYPHYSSHAEQRAIVGCAADLDPDKHPRRYALYLARKKSVARESTSDYEPTLERIARQVSAKEQLADKAMGYSHMTLKNAAAALGVTQDRLRKLRAEFGLVFVNMKEKQQEEILGRIKALASAMTPGGLRNFYEGIAKKGNTMTDKKIPPAVAEFMLEQCAELSAPTVQNVEREAVEVVGYLLAKAKQLSLMPAGTTDSPLMTVAQHLRTVAAKDAAIERQRATNEVALLRMGMVQAQDERDQLRTSLSEALWFLREAKDALDPFDDKLLEARICAVLSKIEDASHD